MIGFRVWTEVSISVDLAKISNGNPGVALKTKMASRGFCFSAKEQATVSPEILKDDATVASISTLRQLFQSCLGPRGRCKLVHNGQGGHVTVTATAGRLLKATEARCPAVRLVTGAVAHHLDAYGDGGCFAGTLAALLVETGLRLPINRRLVADVLDLVAGESIRYLNSDAECPARLTVDLDSLRDLLAVVNGVTSPKSSPCGMTDADVGHVNRCIVEGFLKTAPGSRDTGSVNRRLQYICCYGKRSSSSYVTEGVFLEYPQLSTCQVTSLKPKLTADGTRVATVVYGASLSGDAENQPGVNYEVTPDVDFNAVVLQEIFSSVRNLVKLGVGIVICQKVIHPEVKRYLINDGIMVLDRLGLTKTELLCTVTGCQAVGSFHTAVTQSHIGYIGNIAHEIINERSYLRIEGAKEHIPTLVLFGITEESLNELKHACEAANLVLRQTIESQLVLRGGGVWQKQLALHLLRNLKGNVEKILGEEIMHSRREAITIVEAVANCFNVIYDTINGSMTELADDGAAVSNSSTLILDSLQSAINGLKCAMFTAHLILGVKNLIVDVN